MNYSTDSRKTARKTTDSISPGYAVPCLYPSVFLPILPFPPIFPLKLLLSPVSPQKSLYLNLYRINLIRLVVLCESYELRNYKSKKYLKKVRETNLAGHTHQSSIDNFIYSIFQT